MQMQQQIEQRLRESFAPLHLEVDDESHMHNVPEGAASHFRVVLVSEQFDGKALLQRHRAKGRHLVGQVLIAAAHQDILHPFDEIRHVKPRERHRIDRERIQMHPGIGARAPDIDGARRGAPRLEFQLFEGAEPARQQVIAKRAHVARVARIKVDQVGKETIHHPATPRPVR